MFVSGVRYHILYSCIGTLVNVTNPIYGGAIYPSFPRAGVASIIMGNSLLKDATYNKGSNFVTEGIKLVPKAHCLSVRLLLFISLKTTLTMAWLLPSIIPSWLNEMNKFDKYLFGEPLFCQVWKYPAQDRDGGTVRLISKPLW